MIFETIQMALKVADWLLPLPTPLLLLVTSYARKNRAEEEDLAV